MTMAMSTNLNPTRPTAAATDGVTMTTEMPTTTEMGFFIKYKIPIIASVSALGGLLILLLSIVVFWKIRKCYRRRTEVNLRTDLRSRKSIFISEEDLYSTSTDFTINPRIFWEELKLDELVLDEPTKLKVKTILVPRTKLSIHKLIGEGQYAQVHYGTFASRSGQELKVAVKIMKETWTGQARNLIEEGMLMVDFNHPNVLTIIGISLEFVHAKQIRPLVVMPFLENGDLNSFLKDARLIHKRELAMRWRVEMMVQIASGMEYISEKKIIHRDLATRNCMLDDRFVVKVADFGLARRMYDADFYKMKLRHSISCSLPVKWVAIEGLNDSIFNTSSDVWSFGITMWEIATHAKTPYPGLENYKVLEHLESGHRLRQPEGCPTSLYNLMFICWNENPTRRPSFGFLRERLEELKETITNHDGSWSSTVVRQQQKNLIVRNNPLYDNSWV